MFSYLIILDLFCSKLEKKM